MGEDDDIELEREIPDEGEGAHIIVPPDRLSPEALRGVIVEFVTREGTDYGHVEVPLSTKIAQVRRQLEAGEIVLLFDAKSETINLVAKRELGDR
jgi:hypothetical protein